MVDLTKLAGQGRAFSGSRAWEPEELDALLVLERERGIGRLLAADYIRNGIVTLEAYDASVEAEFTPKTLNEVTAGVEDALKDNDFSGVVVGAVKAKAKAPAKKRVTKAK